MGRTAFLDLTRESLNVFIIDPKTGSGTAGLALPVGSGYAFNAGDIPSDVEEYCLSLPLELLNFRTLVFPFAEERKIRDLIPLEIDGLVLGGSGAVVLDFVAMGEIDGKTRVLVCYVSKEMLAGLLGHLKTAGADPKIVTSLELAKVMQGGKAALELADMLTCPAPMTPQERLSLALREIAHPLINLRRGSFIYTAGTEKSRKALRITSALFILLLLVLLADSVLTAFLMQREIRRTKEAMAKTYQTMFPDEKKVSDELYQLKAHIREYRDKEAYLAGLSPLNLLLRLSDTVRGGISYHEVAMERDRIVLKGECGSLSDVQRVKADVGKFLTGVAITDTRPSAQNRTVFSISAKGMKE